MFRAVSCVPAAALRAGDVIARNPFVTHSDISRALHAARLVDDLQHAFLPRD